MFMVNMILHEQPSFHQAKKSKENDEFAAALAEAGVVFADNYVEDDKKVRNCFNL